MRIRRSSILLSAILSIGVLMTGCSSKNTEATGAGLPNEIRIGYFQSPNGELLAKGEKLLEKKFPDVEIKYVQFDVGRDVNTAIASGSIDIATIGTPPGTTGIVNNLPYKIYYLHDIIGASEALVIKETSGINSVADLKGKKIATPFGSTSHFSLLSVLKQNNISESDVTILDMSAPDIIAAWTRGDIDGTYIWQPAQSQLISEGGKVITTSEEVAAKGAITGEFGIVSNDFASKYPEVVKAYIDILDEATKLYRTQTDAVVKTLSAELGVSVEATKEVMNQITVLDKEQQLQYIGTVDNEGTLPQLLKDTSDFLLSQKVVTSSPDIEFFKNSVRNDLYK